MRWDRLFDDLEAEGREPRTSVIEMEMRTDERAAAALDLAADGFDGDRVGGHGSLLERDEGGS